MNSHALESKPLCTMSINKETQKNKLFTGLSRGYPGIFLRFPENSVYVFPFSQEKESTKPNFGEALNPYILNQDISKWHFSAHGGV